MKAIHPGSGSQSSLRELNRARILGALKHYGGLTQVELAGTTGLSPASVSNIVKELVGAGTLSTAPSVRNGRRAQLVTLSRTLGIVVGIHIGIRELRIALADAAGQVIAERRLPLAADHRADDVLDRSALLVADMLGSVDAGRDELLAAGVGLPAPVDPREGRISVPGIMRGWDGVAVSEVLGTRLGAPAHVDNDATLGALAEHRAGAAVGVDDFAYLRISHRIGAGLVLGGRAFRGAAGAAGEIGHVTIDEHGPICRCGNRGCLETFVSAAVLVELLRGSHGLLTLQDLIRQALDGDPGCRRVIADAGRHLGVAAANLVNLLDPARIVVGGELTQAGGILLDTMRDSLARCALPTADGGPEILTSALGRDAELRGAIMLAIDQAPLNAVPM